MAHDVFISYSSKDQTVAETVCKVLEKQGISCWMSSREIIPGFPDWAAAITQAIQSARVFVLIHSANSDSSDQVMNEIHNADANNLTIIAFKIDQTPYSPGLEYFLQRRQWLDATAPGLEAHAEKLAKTIPILLAGDVNLASRILRTTPLTAEPPAEGDCPYKGLNFFDESDAAIFFGRELLIAKLVGHLRENYFLAVVVGASGSGKSSVVRAGMIPALRAGKPLADKTKPPAGSIQWPIHVITPGIHPLDSLALAVTRTSESVTAADTLVQDMKQTPRALHLYIKKHAPDANTGSLLVVDQFEELFTLCQDPEERKAFIDNLMTASSPETGGALRVVVTLRADFYSHCADYANLREAIAQHQEYIGPMSQEELRRAIEEPARQGKWLLESGLVDLLLRDIGEEPGALPLLSHALLETWHRREGRWMTVRGYVESGGVKGAIARTAESVFSTLSDQEQTLSRHIFLSLTELGEGTQDTRRRVLLEDLFSTREDRSTLQDLVKKLADSRLVTTTETTVEVAHEALIREWPRLREWLNEDRATLRVARRLSSAALEWQQMGRDDGLLYRGARLAEALELDQERKLNLNELESSFMAASILLSQREAQEREEQQRKELEAAKHLAETEKRSAARLRSRNRVISIIGVIALLGAVSATVFGVYASSQEKEAVKQSEIAISNKLAAQSLNTPFDLSVLLSQEALRLNDSPDSRGALLTALSENSPIQHYLRGHEDAVYSVAFSPDGSILASGSWDNNIILWDPKTYEQIGVLVGHTDQIYGIAFSPDGKMIASASQDETVMLWDVSTQLQIGDAMTGHEDRITCVTFSPDGKLLATGDWNGEVRIWNVKTQKPYGEVIFDRENTVLSIAYSPDGKTLAVGYGDGTITLWDAITHEIIGDTIWAHNNSVFTVEFSPDGSILASGSRDGDIVLWDVESQTPIGNPLLGHKNCVNSVKFSPDGRTLASGSWDNTIRLWDVESRTQIGDPFLGHKNCVMSIDFSPDGTQLASGSLDNSIILWKVNPDPQVGEEIHFNESINSFDLGPDGKAIIVSEFRKLWIIDWTTMTQVGDPIESSENVIHAFYSADGKTATTIGVKTIQIWDLASHQQTEQIPFAAEGIAYDVSLDGKKAALGDNNGTILLFDLTAPEKAGQTLLYNKREISSLAFSADGTLLASTADNGVVAIWDAQTGKLIEPVIPGFQSPSALAFSPDRKILAVGASDNTITLWDTATHQQIAGDLNGHTVGISELVFSPDGRYLASGSESGEIILWDVLTHQQIGPTLTEQTGGILDLEFSPDGSHLFSNAYKDKVMIWDLQIESWQKKACSIINRNLAYNEWQQYLPGTSYRLTCPDLPSDLEAYNQTVYIAEDALDVGDHSTSDYLYQELVNRALQTDDYLIQNNLCWNGNLDGYAKLVTPVCQSAYENAVNQEYEYVGMIQDTLGLNYALIGETDQAIENFQVFVDLTKEAGGYDTLGVKRESWIKALQSGEDPFDAETLQALHNE